MLTLPLKSLSEVDKPLVGENLFNLGQLKRAGFDVTNGVVVTPPEVILETILKHIQTKSTEVFEQRLSLIKKEIEKLEVPQELEAELPNNYHFLVKGKYLLTKNQVWQELLSIWFDLIRSKIFREGFSQQLNESLTAQGIFFVSHKPELIEAWFDQNSNNIQASSQSKVSVHQIDQMKKIIESADKKLVLPQVYTFIDTKGLQIVALRPLTHTVAVTNQQEVRMPVSEVKKIVKSAVKVFISQTSGFTQIESADGILFESERFIQNRLDEEDFERIVFRLTEASVQLPGKPIIFRLPDLHDSEVTGTLRLLNQQSLLKRAMQALDLVKNKRGYQNITLGVPTVKSVGELKTLKSQLESSSLWLEITVPENIINLASYLETNLSGVVLNLDRLHQALCGYSSSEGDFYRQTSKTVIDFLQPSFKLFHQAKIPVIANGRLTFESEVLHFLIEEGVYGVVSNNVIEAESLPEHLSWVENRVLEKKLNL